MQTATIDELHNQKHLLMRLKGLIKLCYVWMIELLHNLHFTLDALPPVGFQELELFINFDRYLLVQGFVQTKPHHSVSTLA